MTIFLIVLKVFYVLSPFIWVFNFYSLGKTVMIRLDRKLEGITELHRRSRALLDNLSDFVEEVDLNVEQVTASGEGFEGVLVGFSPHRRLCSYDLNWNELHRRVVWVYEHGVAGGDGAIVCVQEYYSECVAEVFVEERSERIARGRVTQSAVAEGTPLSLSSGAL